MQALSKAFGAASFVAVSLLAPAALAIGEDEASGSGKGTIGGALLGAELVLVVEAAFDVQPTWAYIAGGAAGALAGGYVGYRIEQDQSARVSMLMLASGLTLAIPTTVAVLSATAYEPPVEYLQDTVPPDEPVADPPDPSAAEAPTKTSKPAVKRARTEPRRARPRSAAMALLDIDPERIALAVPAVEVRGVYSPAELFVFGTEQATEVRVPVLTVAF